MYLHVTAYDLMTELHIRCVMVGETQQTGDEIPVVLRRSATVPMPSTEQYEDILAVVAETVLDLAYQGDSGANTGNYR